MLESIFTARSQKSKTHGTISLKSHVTQIILRVMLNWNKSTIREGFRMVFLDTNLEMQFCLRMLIEKSIEKQNICYIDYVKTFDCVKHGKLITLLERLDIDLMLIRNLYYD